MVKVQPDVLIVLDLSGSMNWTPAGSTLYVSVSGTDCNNIDAVMGIASVFFLKDKQYQSLSYSQLYHQTIKLGNLLYSKGLNEQDNIVILLGNQPEWPISFMATQYIGAVAVPIDIKLNPQDICQLILHSQAKVILCSEKVLSQS
jgi:acyl-coenzyme A synthetase/AMP-(fatty) acid ligase